MYKGTELPKNYEQLTLAQKEAIWLGTLLVYEESEYFDEDFWVDEIVTRSEFKLFEDENLKFLKCYNGEYALVNKTDNESYTLGDFWYFFDNEKPGKYAYLTFLGEDYKNVTIREYLREKGFPITAEFWV